jgi:hypothetical protein
MFLDHPQLTATNSNTEPDRIERLTRVYGYAVALATLQDQAEAFVRKFTQLHDHKGTLIVFWDGAPTEAEKDFFLQAWSNKIIGDGNSNVEHEI